MAAHRKSASGREEVPVRVTERVDIVHQAQGHCDRQNPGQAIVKENRRNDAEGGGTCAGEVSSLSVDRVSGLLGRQHVSYTRISADREGTPFRS